MEEIDLCARIWGAGFRCCAISDSEVYHIGGASLNQGNPKKTYLNFRNNLLLIHKNMTRHSGRRMLLARRLADTLAFGMYLLKLDFPNARAILKAHSDFRRMRRDYQDYPSRDILTSLPPLRREAVSVRSSAPPASAGFPPSRSRSVPVRSAGPPPAPFKLKKPKPT